MPPRPRQLRPVRRVGARLDGWLLRVVDGCLAGCIFLVPFLMGGRQALGQFALVTLSVVAAMAWLAREGLRRHLTWRYSAAELLLLAGVVLVVVQLVPLPASVVARASPNTASLLPLWNAEADAPVSLGPWCTISLAPGATRAGLAVLLAYALLFLVTVQRVGALEDIERLLRWIALAAVAMAAFGLVQLLTSNGKFFWFYEHPYSRTSDVAKGAFTNRNHFAHFLALGLGPLLWWLRTDRRTAYRSRHAPRDGFPRAEREVYAKGARPRRRSFGSRTAAPERDGTAGLKGVALGVVLFAALLSLSRGGMLVMLLAAAISVAVGWRARSLSPRFALSLGAVGLLCAVLLSIYGYDRLSARLDTLGDGSLEAVDRAAARRTIWATVARAAGDYALLGSGVGSHREVYPLYLENPPDTEYTHAENGPLQVLLETGAVGLTLVVAGIGLCAFWCVLALRRAPSAHMLVVAGAIAAGLAANVVHSLADFVWYVPGCMAVVAVLCACACRASQLAAEAAGTPRRPIALPRACAWGAVGLLLVVGAWMVQNRFGPTLAERHWDRYRILAMAAGHVNPLGEPQQAADERLTPPIDEFSENIEGASHRAVTTIIAELEEVVRHDPDHARAHLRLAAAYLRQFDLEQQETENAMPLSQIRDAALSARRSSSPEVVAAWLDRVLAERRQYLDLAEAHARAGLALCPFQGEGYLFLAELCFLEPIRKGVRPLKSKGSDPFSDRHLGALGGAAAKPAYLNQALLVRPYDGAVLFEAGREAWLAGDFRRGLDFWQRSFRAGRRYQKQLIHLLCGRVPLEFLVEAFQPDLAAMRLVHARCRELGDPVLLAEARRHHARAAVAAAEKSQGAEGADAYLEAYWLYGLLHERRRALESARAAFERNPNSYPVREALAKSLVALDRAAEAEEHVRWCLARRPNSKELERLSARLVRQRIDHQARHDPQVQPAAYEER